MKRLRVKLGTCARSLDRSLWLGWDVYNNATDERRHVAFPRLSLYFTDIIASVLEGEKCALVRGWELEIVEQEEREKAQKGTALVTA